MAIALNLEKMSREEKVAAMEMLWNDLCENGEAVIPKWHKEVLEERKKRFEQGSEQALEWQDAKSSILNGTGL
jgi:hypothetical protein